MLVTKEQKVPPFLRIRERMVWREWVVLLSAIATTEMDDRDKESATVWTSYNRGKRWKEWKEAEGKTESSRL